MKLCRTNKSFNYSASHVCVFVFFLSVVMFLPFIVMDKGYFTYYADFNTQQIPFYRMVHDAIRSGEFGWNWYTDLGSSLVGSYSFYLLGSPFFWLTVPFPSEWVPYLMAPLLCLKYMFMGLGTYIYLKRFVSKEYAFIGSLLYVFSGFSIYNLPYNHFYEPMIYLPLLLWAMERRMEEGKRGYFALFVFLSAIGNYYFFVGQCIFLFTYWLVRLFSKGWEIQKKNVIGIILEAVLGTCCAACLLIPSALMLMGSDRVSSLLSGLDVFIFKDKNVYLSYLCSFFFPPDLVGDSKFFALESGWSAPTNWLPLFGCLGALTYYLYHGWKDWLSKLILLFFLVGWIPFLNSSFSLLNATYYSRWCYMLSMLLILATVRILEKEDDTCRHCWNKAFLILAVLSGILVLLFFVLPAENAIDKFDTIVFKNPLRVFAIIFFAVVSLLSTKKLLKERDGGKKQFITYIVAFICVFSVLFNWYTIRLGRSLDNPNSLQTSIVVDKAIKGIDEMDLSDAKATYCRVDAANSIDNLCIYWEIPPLQTFNSTVSQSIFNLYDSLHIERIENSRIQAGYYALRSFLSVKKAYDYYYYYYDSDKGCKIDGWKQAGEDHGFQVYENTNFINMGFSYDEYITYSEYESFPYDKREKALLKYLIVSDDNENEISTMLKHGDLQSEEFTYDAFVEDCKERERSIFRDFAITKTGFQSNVLSDKDNFVLYSVPYDKGWSATVNGKPVEIIKSNVGFMSVLCQKGNNEVAFSYSTPGLKSGFLVSVISALLLVLWICFEDKLFKKREFEE